MDTELNQFFGGYKTEVAKVSHGNSSVANKVIKIFAKHTTETT